MQAASATDPIVFIGAPDKTLATLTRLLGNRAPAADAAALAMMLGRAVGAALTTTGAAAIAGAAIAIPTIPIKNLCKILNIPSPFILYTIDILSQKTQSGKQKVWVKVQVVVIPAHAGIVASSPPMEGCRAAAGWFTGFN
jgi:hypothetical protein